MANQFIVGGPPVLIDDGSTGGSLLAISSALQAKLERRASEPSEPTTPIAVNSGSVLTSSAAGPTITDSEEELEDDTEGMAVDEPSPFKPSLVPTGQLTSALGIASSLLGQASGASTAAIPAIPDAAKKPRTPNFKPEEDAKILEGVSHNLTMDQIAALLPGRTKKMVEARYGRLKRKPAVPPSPTGVPTSPAAPAAPVELLGTGKRKATTLTGEEPPAKTRKLSELSTPGSGPLNPALTANNNSNHHDEVDTKESARNAALLTDIAQQKAKLDERERELKQLEETLAQREKERLQIQDDSIKKATRALQELLKENELKSRQISKDKVAQDSLRLGQLTYERVGAEFIETWVEGREFRQIKEQLEELRQEKVKLETRRKELTKRKGEEEGVEQDDVLILKQRIELLKTQTQLLEDQKEKLTVERSVHLKEAKRLQDEEHSTFKDFRVLNERFVLLQLLGKGGFSEVYKAYDLKEFRYVACKIHQLNPLWPDAKKQGYIKHSCREYNIHKSLDHPRVVRLYDVFEIDQNSFGTVMELCSGGDLDTYLKQHNSLAEKESKAIIAQLFQGLRYLNEQKRPIIHYDLKPGNILFDEYGSVKITDFGLSKIMEENTESLELTSQGAGTYWYLPPECFETSITPKISSKVDVWSAGVIFYQMLFGRKPFGHNLTQQKILIDNVIGKSSAVEFPQKPPKPVTEAAKDFIRKCLVPDQAKRPDVLTLMKESYLTTNVEFKKPPTRAKKSAAAPATPVNPSSAPAPLPPQE